MSVISVAQNASISAGVATARGGAGAAARVAGALDAPPPPRCEAVLRQMKKAKIGDNFRFFLFI